MGLFSPSVTSKNINKACQALEAITEDDALAKVALNKKVHNAVRESAAEKISDEVTLARTVTDPGYAGLSVRKICPRIHSQEALDIIRSFISSKQKLPWDWKNREAFRLLRQLEDPDILRKIYKAQTEEQYRTWIQYGSGRKDTAAVYTEMLEDAVKLKECGDDPVMLLDGLRTFPAAVSRSLSERAVREMLSDRWSTGLLRSRMNDPQWIRAVRPYVPEELVLEAFPEGDPDRKQMLFSYQVADGKLFQTKCDFDVHDDVLIRTEKEENPENFNHPLTYSYYECRRCGRRYKIIDDGWGRESRCDRW